jgi:hypothetical protein
MPNESPEKGLARRFWRGAVLFSTAFLALNVWIAGGRRGLEDERRRNLLQATDPSVQGGCVEPMTGESFESYWQRIPDGRTKRLIFVSGMSQMYAINDRQPNDRIIADHLDSWIRRRGARAASLAGPNLCNEEALFFLCAGLSDPARRPAVFVYGVCFDKFRNLDLRREYQEFFAKRTELRRRWLAEAGEAMDLPLAAEKMRATEKGVEPEGRAAAGKKPGEGDVESRLRESVSRVVPVVGAREELNARAQMEMFLLRNWFLRIKPTSKRPVIPARYALNRQFLELLVRVAKQEGIVPILYVIPLNPQAENPYIPAEYEDFKLWVAGLATREGIPFANLEGIVPSPYWGEFMGGPDFKHFRGEGHRMTAAALIERFGAVMAGDGGAGK